MAKTKTKTKVEEISTEVVEPDVKKVTNEPGVIEEVEATPIEYGVVANCDRLNIRKNPDKEVICVVNAGTKLVIDKTYKNKNWLKVTTVDGKEGFCMKEFVTIK